MAVPPADPDRYRRRQRRRALIGWLGGLAVIGLFVLAAAVGGEDPDQSGTAAVPYGDEMTAVEYEAINEGEAEADVLGGLGKTGRPEFLTEDYVLVLFPPAPEDVTCTYWEFSDEREVFARLCFDNSGGELVSKLSHNVHSGAGGEGTIA